MKRLSAQLCVTVIAALFSLMTLATLPDLSDTVENGPAAAEPAPPGTTFRFVAFAVRFVTARLLWGS